MYSCFYVLSLPQDKQNIPWWMGMSPKGVGVYDHSDKTKPRKVSHFFILILDNSA